VGINVNKSAKTLTRSINSRAEKYAATIPKISIILIKFITSNLKEILPILRFIFIKI